MNYTITNISVIDRVPQLPVDDDKMDGLQERLLKELVKSINANTQSIVPQIAQTPLTVKKEEPKPKNAPSTSQGKGKRGKGRARKKRPVKRCPQSGSGGRRPSRKRTRQRGGGLDIQKWISKLGVEFY